MVANSKVKLISSFSEHMVNLQKHWVVWARAWMIPETTFWGRKKVN